MIIKLERKKKRKTKGKMARRLVYFCISVLTATALWAAAITTIAAYRGESIDLSAVLTYIGAAFGGELLLLLVKRVFAKPSEESEEDIHE